MSFVNNNFTTSSTIPVANGWTGQTTYTNGQLLIGNTTGNTLTKGTITGSSHISVTNGTGSIALGYTNQDFYEIQHRIAHSTGGGTLTGSTWNSRALTTFSGTYVSVASNLIVFQPGTYIIYASSPAYEVHAHRIRLRNTSTSAILTLGTCEFAPVGGSQTRSVINCKLTFVSTTSVALEHWCANTRATIGGGLSTIGITDDEIHSIVRIQKL